MPLSILFDLDDTLLFTNMDRFLPGYFDLLGQALDHLGSQKTIICQIQIAVQKMVANNDPGKTLKEVFDDHFYEPLGTTEEDCKEILTAFYRDEYPRLQPITQAKPEAKDLVNWCLAEGMTVAIATNPLFPQTATRQRIQWAGLDPEKFSFFSAYDDFHFTKPHLAYYAEVLGRLGWPQQPAVMIGDSLTHDLHPMQTMGYKTFWINQNNPDSQQPSGTIADVKPWLTKDHHNDDLPNNALEVNIAILQSTPAVLDSWLRQPPSSPMLKRSSKMIGVSTMMLHQLLRSENDFFQPHLESVRQQKPIPTSVLEAPLEDTWLHEQDGNPDELFTRFLSSRQRSLALLNEIMKNPAISHSFRINQKGSAGFTTIIELISRNDRKQLSEYVNMLDIHKNN